MFLYMLLIRLLITSIDCECDIHYTVQDTRGAFLSLTSGSGFGTPVLGRIKSTDTGQTLAAHPHYLLGLQLQHYPPQDHLDHHLYLQSKQNII